MTISPNPRIFDFSNATAVPGAGDPDLQRVFWHGTRACLVDEIMEHGLLPGKTICGHTCLTTDPAMALLFARLQQSLSYAVDEDATAPVLIRIDGAHLDPDACKVETGTLTISAYGESLPGRSKRALREASGNWRSFMQATDTLGYTGVIPVGEHMLERRTQALSVLSVKDILKEMEQGLPSQAEAIHLLSEINAEMMPAMAA